MNLVYAIDLMLLASILLFGVGVGRLLYSHDRLVRVRNGLLAVAGSILVFPLGYRLVAGDEPGNGLMLLALTFLCGTPLVGGCYVLLRGQRDLKPGEL
jgi:hypothetical protein